MALPLDQQGNPEWLVAREVFAAAVNDSRTREKGADALVEAFVRSWSYDTTRYLWSLIERVPSFTPDRFRRLEYAVQVNDQVYNANVNGELVPDLVKTLVEKFDPPSPWTSTDEPPF